MAAYPDPPPVIPVPDTGVAKQLSFDFAKHAAAVDKFAADSKEKESHDLAKSRGRRKKTQRPEQSPAEALESVLEGIATVNPFWRVTYFKFDSPEDAVRFWKEVEIPSI